MRKIYTDRNKASSVLIIHVEDVKKQVYNHKKYKTP